MRLQGSVGQGPHHSERKPVTAICPLPVMVALEGLPLLYRHVLCLCFSLPPSLPFSSPVCTCICVYVHVCAVSEETL